MRSIIFVALLLPPGANALSCSFTTECVGAEACKPVSVELTLTRSDDYQSAEIMTASGTFRAQASNFQGMSSFTGFTGNTMHMLSYSASGDSRYTAHTGDQSALVTTTFLGTCS